VKTLLIIEDDEVMVKLYKTIIQHELPDVSAAVATSIDEALQCVKSISFDLYQVDINVNGDNGLTDFLYVVRQQRDCTPAIVVSAHQQHEVNDLLLGTSAFSYVCKAQTDFKDDYVTALRNTMDTNGNKLREALDSLLTATNSLQEHMGGLNHE